MSLLSVSHISKAYGTDSVLTDITLQLEAGERVGLIGRNGAGKSTLFRILTGQTEADAGQVRLQPGKTVGYLKQEAGEAEDRSLFDFCLEVFGAQLRAEADLRAQEDAMHHGDPESAEYLALLDAYHQAVEAFEAMGGYTFRSRVVGVLKGLGFAEEELGRSALTLSGGQLTRLSIARLLLSEPDVLLLDEPTNHLDIGAVAWLEGFLRQYRGTLLLITHDRYFLDQVTTRIVEIEHGRALSHTGNYTAFQTFKQQALEARQKAFEKQEAELARQEDLIRRFRQHGTEKLAKRARSREKRLEQVVRLEAPEGEESRFRLELSAAAPSGQEVLTARDLTMGFDGAPLFSNLSFTLYRGERVGLIGPNGIGKTTLFRLILGELQPLDGALVRGHHVLPGSYDQTLRFASEDRTLLQELVECRPDLTDTRLRSLLGAFLFTGDDVFKQLKVLSGGERARLSLLKLLLGTSNFLLMDEPTNHLDIPAREVLEEALLDYSGTLLVISHDRYFLNRVCDRILALTPEGAESYPGNYSYYLSKQQPEPAAAPPTDTVTKTQLKEQKRREKDLERSQRSLKREIQSAEQQIEALEAEIERLTLELCQEAVYASPERSVAVQGMLETAKEALNAAYDQWNSLLEQNQNLL